ncbi:MAG TPA: insulinase family protein [Phycisphaerales bacterium]|nr:insulinase family protein [Phycisphaerales bacterium]
MGHISTHTLNSGLRVLIEPIPSVESVGISWLFQAGTASEPQDRAGIASMTCEMLLRGGGTRDSRTFADDLDRIGATRSVDCTGRTTHVRCSTLGDRLHDVLPMLTDMVREPRLEAATLEPARELALQALESLNDDPRERAVINASARHFPAPFNRSIYGDESGIKATTVDDVRRFWSTHAAPNESILAIAGNVDPETALARIDGLLGDWIGQSEHLEVQNEPKRGPDHIEDDSNQVQILLLAEAPCERDERAALLTKIAVNVLSGGMSGRLFSEVREKRGLCYTVSASYQGDDRFGVLSAYVGTAPDRAQQSLDVLTSELERIFTPDGAVSEAEFHRAKIGMKTNVVFHSESSAGRAAGLSGDVRRLGRARSLDEILSNLESVTLDELNAYLASASLEGITLQTLGPTALTPPASLGL